MSHFKLTTETKTDFGRTLYRVEAIIDLPHHSVNAGDKGGFVEKESNLSSNAWVFGDARVYGDARVFGNALVSDDAEVFGDARVFGNALVSGDALVFGDAWVSGDALVSEREHILVVHPIGSEQVTATLYRTKAGHSLTIGCWSGTVDGLAAEAERRSKNWEASAADHDRWLAEYGALEALCRARVESWTNDGGVA